MARPVPEKLDIFHINLSSQNKLKHGVVTCHDSYLQFPQSLLGTPTTRPPFWHVHKKKKRREMLASKTIIDPHFV